MEDLQKDATVSPDEQMVIDQMHEAAAKEMTADPNGLVVTTTRRTEHGQLLVRNSRISRVSLREFMGIPIESDTY